MQRLRAQVWSQIWGHIRCIITSASGVAGPVEDMAEFAWSLRDAGRITFDLQGLEL